MTRYFRLGLFILTASAMFASGVFLVGRQTLRLTSTYRLRTEFQTVFGLDVGAQVRVGGMHKGTVRSILLPSAPDGKITVVMDLSTDTRPIVRRDSVASIQSEGLLGDKYVEVSFGSTNAAHLSGGETIDSKPPMDISDLMVKANGILDTGQQALSNIQDASENISLITGKINKGQGTAGQLVNDKTLYREASAGITALREDAEALKQNFFLRGFFRQRGYNGAADFRQHEVAELPKAAAARTFEFDPEALFDKPGTAKLRNTKQLQALGQFLQSNSFDSVVIVSSVDRLGDSAKARELSVARSFVVRQYLTEHFRFDDTRVKIAGLGKASADAKPALRVQIYGKASKQAAAR